MRQALKDFSIRTAMPGDARLLPAIERSAGEFFLGVADLAWIATDEVMSVDSHREIIANGTSWVAVNQHDAPVAFLSAKQIGGNLHIEELSVHSACQQLGLGRALIEQAAIWAKTQGFPSITLTTFRGVRWNEPFYQTVGFITLDACNLSTALKFILDEEMQRRLPRDRHCAMAFLISK